MSHNWGTSKRRKDPANWQAIKALVSERANGRCQDFMRDGTQCTDAGTECDHIINLANGGTDALDNLQMLCEWHHKRKTAREAADARKSLSIFRPKEQHPGFK